MNPLNPISNTSPSRLEHATRLIFELCLIILILTGLFFRFNWVNWNLDTNLHPDEYGLTSTLTQLSIPDDLDQYFNTRISPLSPYQKYDLAGQVTQSGPDNRMRWGQLPMTIIRLTAEMTGNTGYGELRLMGRGLSALADTLSLFFIFLIGLQLYGRTTGLLATALSALAVMQIQQSHFMTVDNFGSFFTTLTLFACVQIARIPPVARETGSAYHVSFASVFWHLLFGIGFGMALACKVNLLPVGGLALVGAFIGIADLKLKTGSDLKRIAIVAIALLAFAYLTGLIVFRLAQPMSFRAATGDTSLLTLQPNPDWVESMKVASAESSGQGGGPPGEQWAHRLAVIFPLTNMVLWGMGLPLGLTAWFGFGAALWQVVRYGKNWRAHLLPLVWSGGYFFFMGTRWVKSIRYFLPIYPFLTLLAAWGLMETWRWASSKDRPAIRPYRLIFASTLMGISVVGTLAWANTFVQAVYAIPHTRVQATRWIFENIPGPFHLTYVQADGSLNNEPIGAPDNLEINAFLPYQRSFTLPTSGQLTTLMLPKVHSSVPGILNVMIANDPDGQQPLGEMNVAVLNGTQAITIQFPNIPLQENHPYYLIASSPDKGQFIISRNIVANESWDEGLPVPFDGHDPFGQLYSGRTMEVRWPDDIHKREVLLQTLSESDYLVLPSQRAIWSTCRIPLTYPMTMEYYRALFDGRLGFEQVAHFSAPFKLGPLWISDVGGTAAWNRNPDLPLFNSSLFAAEEAFSVYDHPPVWIFKKRPDFDLAKASSIFNSVDLSQVVVQSALNAEGDWCPAQ